MKTIFEQFTSALDRIRTIHQLYIGLSSSTTAVLDLSDLLRAEMVLIVSALDYFIHGLVRVGMVEVCLGIRPPTDMFHKFPIPLASSQSLASGTSLAVIIESEVRQAHSLRTFQRPDAIADAIRLCSNLKLWDSVSLKMNLPSGDAKRKLAIIVDRRNKIAHEADIDPSYPGQRWAIDRQLTEDALTYVETLGTAIFDCLVLP